MTLGRPARPFDAGLISQYHWSCPVGGSSYVAAAAVGAKTPSAAIAIARHLFMVPVPPPEMAPPGDGSATAALYPLHRFQTIAVVTLRASSINLCELSGLCSSRRLVGSDRRSGGVPRPDDGVRRRRGQAEAPENPVRAPCRLGQIQTASVRCSQRRRVRRASGGRHLVPRLDPLAAYCRSTLRHAGFGRPYRAGATSCNSVPPPARGACSTDRRAPRREHASPQPHTGPVCIGDPAPIIADGHEKISRLP